MGGWQEEEGEDAGERANDVPNSLQKSAALADTPASAVQSESGYGRAIEQRTRSGEEHSPDDWDQECGLGSLSWRPRAFRRAAAAPARPASPSVGSAGRRPGAVDASGADGLCWKGGFVTHRGRHGDRPTDAEGT